MKPVTEVTIDGAAVAGAFYERLIELTVTDKAGIEADSFEMRLNDGPPGFLAMPRTGAIVDIRIGYQGEGLRSLGTFTADRVSGKCLPYSLSIGGKSADLRAGKLKENRERHWDDATLATVIGDIAAEAGLQAAVDPGLAAYRYDWIGQQDESDIHFLRRLERRHNGLFSVKGGRLVFARRGSGASASGLFGGSVIVTPDRAIRDTIQFEANDRTKYRSVVAYYQDRDAAERVELSVDADADGESVYRIPEPFGSPAEADEAARSKAKALKRGGGDASVEVVGDTAIAAGVPLIFQDIRPGLDGVPYVIETVRHTISKRDGYRCRIDAKLYDGSSADGNRDAGGRAAEGDATAEGGTSDQAGGGEVAPDAPAGTPPTPSQFLTPRRSGRTDDN